MSELQVLKVKTRYYRTYCGQGIWVRAYLRLPPPPSGEEHDRCSQLRALTSGWIANLYVTNLNDYEAYCEGLSTRFEPSNGGNSKLVFDQAPGTPTFKEVYARGYIENVNRLEHLPRANAYRYEMPVHVNAATVGAVTELEKMVGRDLEQDGIEWADQEIASLLGVLNAFWD